VLPGGVNSPVRAFRAVGGTPFFVARAAGARLTDVDGKSYLDYVCSWGPLILGHAHPAVLEAIAAAAAAGWTYGAPCAAEVELAELVCRRMPALERVRFVNSGTEATMAAVRLARAATARSALLKFDGCYHGHADSFLVKAGSGVATLGLPASPGVPAPLAALTLTLPFNDPAALAELFRRRGDELAAVIVEPYLGNVGFIAPEPEFLATLRAQCDRYGALLIFDEVMTGFRVAYGGAQSLLSIRPDLTTLGKIVGGGLPVGAYGGRRDIMDHVLPAGKVFQAGTLSGNPLATAAGIATLKVLRDETPYGRLEQLSARLAAGLCEAATTTGVAHSLARVGSMLTLFFNRDPVVDWTTASRSDTAAYARYFWGLIDRGVYMPCSQYEALFVSTAHSEADIDATIAAARDVFKSPDFQL
jgi:glutamate-1-semialdehyde 2,1-aminomutase